MQCFSCFTDAQRGNPHLTHGLHLDNPAKQKDTSISQHQSPDTCSPVSNCSEDSHVTSSSGSGSSDGGHYAADVSSWQVRDQVLSSQQDRPSKDTHSTQMDTTATATAAPHDTLYPYILQHGRGILSLSTLQQGLQHFLVPGVGYIAYSMMYNGPDWLNIRTPVALGDPICDPANFGMIAGAFLNKHPKAMFMQVSAAFALVLRSYGLLINSVGGETQLDLATYTFSGYAKRGLRSAIASAAKGMVVEEVMHAPVTPEQLAGQGPAAAAAAGGGSFGCSQQQQRLMAEMREVDRQWLSRKGKHAGRVWFINRLPVFASERGVRKFTAREAASGVLLGFIFFDGVYEASKLVGYYANVTRMRPDAHPGVLNLLVSNFMDRVREEGRLSAPTKKISVKQSLLKKQQQQQQQASDNATSASSPAKPSSSSSSCVRFISLGLSPLYQMNDDTFTCSNRIRLVFELSFKQGSGYYPFQPLAAAKAKYGAGLHDGRYNDSAASYQQVYLAHSHHKLACVAMFDLGKMLGFWQAPPDAAAAFLTHKIKDGSDAIKETVKKIKQRRSSSSGGGSSKKGGDKGSGSSSSGFLGCKSSGSRRRCVSEAGDGSSSIAIDSNDDDGVMPPGCMLRSFAAGRSSSRRSSASGVGSSTASSTAIAAATGGSSASASASSSSSSVKAPKERKLLLPLVRPVISPFPAMIAGTAAAAAAGAGAAAGTPLLLPPSQSGLEMSSAASAGSSNSSRNSSGGGSLIGVGMAPGSRASSDSTECSGSSGSVMGGA